MISGVPVAALHDYSGRPGIPIRFEAARVETVPRAAMPAIASRDRREYVFIASCFLDVKRIGHRWTTDQFRKTCNHALRADGSEWAYTGSGARDTSVSRYCARPAGTMLTID